MDEQTVVPSIWSGAQLTLDFVAAIVDHVAHPIFVKDRQFRFVLLNRALCEMVGRTREQMLGKTDYDFFPRDEADFFRRKDVEMFTTGHEVVIDEEPITDASGVRHVLATTKVPLRGDNGEVTHLVGIIHDITRLKEVEAALRDANDECARRLDQRTVELAKAQQELVRKERLSVLGQLAGGVAHQIRNPLAAIRNAASILRSTLRGHADPVAARAVEIVDDEVSYANRIVTDLLDYARLRPASLRPTQVGYVLEQALGALAIPDDVRLVRALPDLPDVAIDADQLQTALYTVLRNAVEAMAAGGTLTVGGSVESDVVEVTVDDTGAGVAVEMRGRLFDPMFTTKRSGLGLGLTTARSLVENQGGTISCTDAPAGGARFVIRLPIAS